MLLSPTAAGPIFPVTSVALPPAPGSADKPYVFSITALGERSLVLAHGSAHLTVVDRASLQVTDGWACAEPDGHVTSVVANAAGGEVWTTGQDGVVRTWDSRVKGGRAEGSQASHMRGASSGMLSACCRLAISLTTRVGACFVLSRLLSLGQSPVARSPRSCRSRTHPSTICSRPAPSSPTTRPRLSTGAPAPAACLCSRLAGGTR